METAEGIGLQEIAVAGLSGLAGMLARVVYGGVLGAVYGRYADVTHHEV